MARKFEDKLNRSDIANGAEHPVLAFLNTVSQVQGRMVDALQTGDDVLAFLQRHGFPLPRSAYRSATLVRCARRLRSAIQKALQSRKSNTAPKLGTLNRFLAADTSHLRLMAAANGELTVTRRWTSVTDEELLSPIAEAAARLLADGDFSRMRQCESETCVLWFEDRTSARRRRWCSMQVCGNRNKVAAHRARTSQESAV